MTSQTDVVDAGRGAEPLLETSGLTKAFGPVEVLSDISLAFRAGEVHAIIGENGAGKSTLMKIISGHLEPTRGSLRFDGAPLTLRGPVDAERRGIVLVHQEIMLAPDLSIAENMFLGRELRRGVAVDDRTMNARAEEAMRVFGVDVSVTVPVQRLSIARRQLAQIARALAVPHRIAIFDEPTASLTPVETGALLKLIRELKAQGVAVVYISHRLEEVKAIADVVTVLRAAFPGPRRDARSDWAIQFGVALPSLLRGQARVFGEGDRLFPRHRFRQPRRFGDGRHRRRPADDCRRRAVYCRPARSS